MEIAEAAARTRFPRAMLPAVAACAAGIVPALTDLGKLRAAVPESPSPWGYPLFLAVAAPLFLVGTAFLGSLLKRSAGCDGRAARSLDRAGLLLYPAMGLAVPLVRDPHDLRLLQGIIFLTMVAFRGGWLLMEARRLMLGDGISERRKLLAATLVPLVVFLGIASWTATTSSTVGDEPYYLMVAESIIRDGDLVLDNQYRPESFGRYFWRDRLAPQNMERTPQGWRSRAYATLFPLLIAPSMLADPRWGPVAIMVILAALLAGQIFMLSRESTGDAEAAFFAWAVAGFTLPVLGFSWQIYPETAAALVVAVMLRGFGAPRSRAAGVMVLGCLLLAGLKIRYLPLGLALTAVYALQAVRGGERGRGAWTLLWTVAGVGLVLATDYFLLDGALVLSRFSTPNLVFRGRKLLRFLPAALTGLAADQEFGILFHSPLYLLLPAGVWWSFRRPSRAVLLLVPPLAYLLVLVGHFGHLWYGGFSQPGRYLVVLLPFAAPLMATAHREGKGVLESAVTALALGWSLLLTVPYLLVPVFRYNRADGTNNMLEAMQERLGLQLTDLFPSFTNAEAWSAGGLLSCWALLLAPAAAVVAWAALERRTGKSARASWRRVCGTALIVVLLAAVAARFVYSKPTRVLEAETLAQEGGTLYTGFGRGPVRVFQGGGWVEGRVVTRGRVSGSVAAGVRGEGRPVLAVRVDDREVARVTLRASPEGYRRESYGFTLETPPGTHRLRISIEPPLEGRATVYLDRVIFTPLP